MSDCNVPGTGDLRCFITGTGTEVALVPAPAGSIGQTLAVNTYFFPIGSQNAPTPSQSALVGIHLKWAAAVTATITFEFCNFPAILGALNEGTNAPTDVTDYEASGNWVPWNPSTAGAFTVQVSGASNTVTALTITAGGAAAGVAFVNLPDSGCRRVRVKVVTTVGGLMRINARGKFAE